jgi:hypothetical protein
MKTNVKEEEWKRTKEELEEKKMKKCKDEKEIGIKEQNRGWSRRIKCTSFIAICRSAALRS